MQITKRDGRVEAFDAAKIRMAVEKAFSASSVFPSDEKIGLVVSSVVEECGGRDISVEQVQDIVEEKLMGYGYYKTARAYILYRENRAGLRTVRRELVELIGCPDLEDVLSSVQKDYPDEGYGLSKLRAKVSIFLTSQMDLDERLDALTKAAVELASAEEPRWEFIAARLLYFQFRRRVESEMEKRHLTCFYDKLRYLTDEGLYYFRILESYSRQEIETAYGFIDIRRDNLFTYSGLDLLLKRYVIKSHSNVPLELVQEMYLSISLHLAIDEEREVRMSVVKDFYDALSRLELSLATPTLSNARKPFHQLSSCFIDTVPDSLDGIYRSLDNFAKVSKFGGGMGLYFGKVRAAGSAIRGFEGAAGGIIRWIRLVNDTAVAVDQLGVRSGAVAVYLDVWHKDMPEFLNLRTNNGDDRMKAHDVFPAICYPDYFWKQVETNLDGMWYMMCPYEIHKVKGYHLEDFYGEEWERRYLECVADNRISKRSMVLKDLVRLIIKSAVETGTPFVFNRDHVNRANPNAHMGMIYSSNLCTEIAQNMSPIEAESVTMRDVDGSPAVVTVTRPGDFVVCNLASLVLGNIDTDDDEKIRSLTRLAIRALDNVIDLNMYPLEYARYTNKRYRAVGLGVSGYHHMLAKKGIKWESQEHLDYVDALFEKINMAAVEASSDLASQRGSYACFKGSAWQTGEYFDYRHYNSPQWDRIRKKVAVQGMRNAYLMAIAPTSSTSIITGTSSGVDPVMKRFFYEEKKGAMLPRIAPDLGVDTWWYYKNAHEIDQSWSVRADGVRTRHIDQAQSVNLYITNDYTMRQVLDLLVLAWKEGVKSLYYTRSKSLEVEECESCSS